MTRDQGPKPDPAETPRKRREAPGQYKGEELVDWLNREPETPKQREQQERVSTILRLLAESVDAQNATGSRDFARQYDAAHPFYERIAELLSQYSYTPDIRLTWQGNLLSAPPWKLPRLFDYDDYKAVWEICRLAELGRLSAIHQCDGCSKWIFAKRAGQSTCGEARCRARKMRKSLTETELVERREKAKARYYFNKTKNAKRRKDAKR